MQAPPFASPEFTHKQRQPPREPFLKLLDGLVPWAALQARSSPVYSRPGRGRRPDPLAVMRSPSDLRDQAGADSSGRRLIPPASTA